MSEQLFERTVRQWLEDGSDRTPRPAIDAVLLAVKTTPQERGPWFPWRFTTMPTYLRPVALVALLAAIGAGGLLSLNSPGPAGPSPAASPSGTAEPQPSPSARVAVRGWPSTGQNLPGNYSWDGDRCAWQSCSVSSSGGFMHNGYGSAAVAITIGVAPEDPVATGATEVTIAGHRGLHRRVVEPEPSFVIADNPGLEEWIVEIDGVLIAIGLYAHPGASDADLAEARAIIDSLRYEPSTRAPVGFRLVFTLATGDWDSG